MVSLIICTYNRHLALKNLLGSIEKSSKMPDEILVVDSSTNLLTSALINNSISEKLNILYFLVKPEHRGLTKQRNYGIDKVNSEAKIVVFLDDDVIVEPDYFEKLIETYSIYPEAIGVGGINLKDNEYCRKQESVHYNKFNYYELDGWVVREPLRNIARKIFGLMPDLQPGLIPAYSNGRSDFPPNNKIYEVEHMTGMSMSFRIELFEFIKFSLYFEGYGLYEDFDFCVRALQKGKLYVNTNAKVWHFHESSGRPNPYKYGKMVIRNGWYVWRTRYPNPSFKARIQWHATMLLLAKIRLINVITGPDRKVALSEFNGRFLGFIQLIFRKPNMNNNEQEV